MWWFRRSTNGTVYDMAMVVNFDLLPALDSPSIEDSL